MGSAICVLVIGTQNLISSQDGVDMARGRHYASGCARTGGASTANEATGCMADHLAVYHVARAGRIQPYKPVIYGASNITSNLREISHVRDVF